MAFRTYVKLHLIFSFDTAVQLYRKITPRCPAVPEDYRNHKQWILPETYLPPQNYKVQKQVHLLLASSQEADAFGLDDQGNGPAYMRRSWTPFNMPSTRAIHVQCMLTRR